MTFRRVFFALLCCFPVAAAAQDGRGVSVGGSVSATNLDARTSWSFAGSFEYRVNRVAGLEVEATVVPTLKSDFPGVAILAASTAVWTAATGSLTFPAIFPQPRFENLRGRAVLFTNNVRLHIPTTSERLDPYFVAGGGISNIRYTADYIYGPVIYSFPEVTPGSTSGILPPNRAPGRTFIEAIRSSSTDLALAIGGGVGVRATSRLWIEGDLRMFRLLGREDRNVGRFGVGVRYRF